MVENEPSDAGFLNLFGVIGKLCSLIVTVTMPGQLLYPLELTGHSDAVRRARFVCVCVCVCVWGGGEGGEGDGWGFCSEKKNGF